MSWLSQARARDDEKRREQDQRQQGWNDGYAGRPATSPEAVYQVAWRRGRQARENDEA